MDEGRLAREDCTALPPRRTSRSRRTASRPCKNEKKEAIAHQDFEQAASLRDEERKLRQDIAQKRAAWEERKKQQP